MTLPGRTADRLQVEARCETSGYEAASFLAWFFRMRLSRTALATRRSSGSKCRRWYAPSVGRYTKPDPVGLVGAINLYGYVEQNPLKDIDPLGLRKLGLGGTVVNLSKCCVLVSENGPTSGQQQFYVKPHSTSGSHDVDAIYFNDGSALKIPDWSIYVVYDCDALNASPTGFLSRPLLSYLHIPKYRTKPLPNRRAQEHEFGRPILPPPPTCGCP